MKSVLLYFLFVFLSSISFSQTVEYDSTLAKRLGGDELGMKSYILAILKTGPNDVKDSVLRSNLFKGHMANIGRLSDEGKLVLAGPLDKNDLEYRGIFILNVTTIEEAQILLQTDPTIKEKIFDVELFKWYGSAALPVHIEAHKKIQKNK